MPAWEGKWAGGRYYFDDKLRPVFFIELRRPGAPRSIKLNTHDPDNAAAELALFLRDPAAYCRPAPAARGPEPVFITLERVTLYLESIHKTVVDHRKARASYLKQWADLKLDLRTVDRQTLRAALASFSGGHRSRTETLNAFCRFLVKEEVLPSWNPLVNNREPEATRAERVAYSLDELKTAYDAIEAQPLKDLFLLRAATGMHQTEIDQLDGCKLYTGPLPKEGVGIRKLGGKHEIQGVIQVMHKSRDRHRQPVTAPVLRAALRLREGVPHRVAVWKALEPLGIVPSNLRHTFATLAQEVGVIVQYKGAGVDRARVARALGHRAGSTMLADRYEQNQVPELIRLPLEDWDVL